MFPYSCDARLYYLPIVTGVLIVINVLAYSSVVAGHLNPDDGWVLQYAAGLHPGEWVLSRFMHVGWGHLLGNMFFLWAFGLVVEGKLGWWRFLACYVGIAVGQAAIEQAIMSGPTASQYAYGSVGPSAAIYGIMAMACIWAPVNQLQVWLLIPFEMRVAAFAALFVGLDFLLWMLLGWKAGSSILHLMGGAMGAVIGLVMLKRGVVDCEDWDLLSVLSGTYGGERKRLREVAETTAERAAAHFDKQALELWRKFDAYLEIDQPEQSLAAKRRAANMGRALDLSRKDLVRLITALQKHGKWADSAPIMAELIEVFPVDSQSVRLKLAQICLMELDRPGRALELLAGLDVVVLPPPQEALRKKIVAAAERRISEGAIEVDDGGW